MPELRGDLNPPARVVVPQWGPDAYSRRMAVRNALQANPAVGARSGVGVRPAPAGASFAEGTKSNTLLFPQQFFRGVVKAIVDPSSKSLKNVSSFPAATVQVNPVLLQLNADRFLGRWS